MSITMNVSLAGSRDRQLEELLQACGFRSTSIKVEELSGLAQPASPQPAVIVLDMRERTTLPAAVATLRRQHPATGLLIVADRHEPALMLEAMRAGVKEFLVLPLTPPELQTAVARVAAQSVPVSSGEVFAFLGAKGGVGTTTVAVNVATAMARVEKGSTLLIDLHLAYGDAAVFLGTEPRFSVIDAVENVHRLDKAFLGGLVGNTHAGLAFLASSDRATTMSMESSRIRALIEAVAQHYRYVVLDVPRSDSFMLDVLEPASRIVIVANQELATLRAATRVAATLRQRYGKERVSVVVSRFDHLAEIGRDDVERVLGIPVARTLPSNYRLALEALNTGRPVVLDNHNKLAAALTGFAHGLIQTTDEPPAARRTAGLFGRFTGRRSSA